MQNKIQEIIKYVTIIICIIIAVLSIYFTVYFKYAEINNNSETCRVNIDNFAFNIINVCIIFILFYCFYKKSIKIKEKNMLIIAVIISAVIGFAWVNYIKFYPNSDQLLIIYSADNLLNKTGHLVLDPGQYLDRYPHQLGFVIYVMIIFKILNVRSNMIILQNLNVIYSAINAILLYLICKELFDNEKVRKIAIIIITIFSILFFTFFNVHIYGNIPGLVFALLAVLFTIKFVKNRKIYNLFLVTIFLSIAYLLKSNYQIFMIGIICILLLDVIKRKQFKYIVGVAMIILTIFGLKNIIYNVFEKSTGYSFKGGVPMSAYMYMGIAPNGVYSPGWYTGDVEKIYNESEFSTEKSNEMSKKLYIDRIKYFVQNPVYALDFFAEKFATTWLNPTYQTLWCSIPGNRLDMEEEYKKYIDERPFIEEVLSGKIYIVLERIEDAFQICLYASAALGIYKLRKKDQVEFLVLPLIFLGGLAFHLIWETKAIYVIQYYYILIPFAAYGIYEFSKYIEENKIIEKMINKMKRTETK